MRPPAQARGSRGWRPGGRGLAGLVLLVVALTGRARAQAPRAGAAGSDYQTGNPGWNGLSTLEALARGMGLTVVEQSQMAWDDIDPGDLLFIIYPQSRIQPGHLAAFVHNGGRVLVADDFGKSDDALARLGILRGAADNLRASAYYDHLPWAPEVGAVDRDHLLARGVGHLTCNHPSVWSTLDGPHAVFGFAGGDTVVATVTMQDGRLVALSDPSILINRMLEFDGNLAFAINLLRFLERPGRTDRLVILTGDVTLYGQPTRLLGDSAGDSSVSGVLGRMNQWLFDLEEYAPMPGALRIIGLLVALVVAVMALVVLPKTRAPALDGSWTRARRGGSNEVATAEEVLAEVDREGIGRRSFALPAAILRDSVGARLAQLVDEPDPLYALSDAELSARVERAAGPVAAQAVRQLVPSLRGLPTRAQAASPWQALAVSEREFARLSAAAAHLYRSLGQERAS